MGHKQAALTLIMTCSPYERAPFSSLSEALLSGGSFSLHSQILLTQQAVPELPSIRLMLGREIIQLQPTPKKQIFQPLAVSLD